MALSHRVTRGMGHFAAGCRAVAMSGGAYGPSGGWRPPPGHGYDQPSHHQRDPEPVGNISLQRNSHHSLDQKTPPKQNGNRRVCRVTFKIQYHVGYGQSIKIVGHGESLGAPPLLGPWHRLRQLSDGCGMGTACSLPPEQLVSLPTVGEAVLICEAQPLPALLNAALTLPGFWSLANSPALQWGNEDVWSCRVELPQSSVVEYKYVVIDSYGQPTSWQTGNNNVLAVKMHQEEMEVTDNWFVFLLRRFY